MRFERVWAALEARRSAGEPLDRLLGESPTRDLVAALAAAGARDPHAANAIATELLNREARAPFLGAFLVSLTTLLAVFVTDWALTGTMFVLATGPVAIILSGFSAALAVATFLLYRLARGGLPLVRQRLLARFRG